MLKVNIKEVKYTYRYRYMFTVPELFCLLAIIELLLFPRRIMTF